jgi:hypothetical protein
MVSDNQNIRNIYQVKQQFMLSNLARAAATSKRGVPDWRIENTFETMIQDELSLESRLGTGSTKLLDMLRAGMQTVQVPQQPAEDKMEKLLTSLVHFSKEQTKAITKLTETINNP